MSSSVKMPSPTPQWEDLPLDRDPELVQLDNIKTQLDLVLLALEALARITSEAILQAAAELNLESLVKDRVDLWRLRQSNPQRKSQGGRKKLDVEEARALVLIACHLAKQEQQRIRGAIELLEECAQQNRQPHQAAFLGDYLDAFSNIYQERMADGENISPNQLENLAFKLLIELLFYSGPFGHRRFWLALLNRAGDSDDRYESSESEE